MKGVNKCVVEIVEPEDENIERVLVFLKPGCEAQRLGCGREAAEKYASGLVTWRRAFWPVWGIRLLTAALTAGAAGAAFWLLR